MKLTGWRVFRNGELIFDNVDIEIPDMPGFHPVPEQAMMEWINESEIVKFHTVDGGDIRKGAIDV
jgi:hypothetical protein